MASITFLADSLSMDEIPVKLRCASCSKLASNAFRTPCCDQSICESCHDNLPITCPICLHEPVKAEDCKPNKALRITIKAFLKKKTMDRETATKKDLPKKVPAAPEQPTSSAEGISGTSRTVQADAVIKPKLDLDREEPEASHVSTQSIITEAKSATTTATATLSNKVTEPTEPRPQVGTAEVIAHPTAIDEKPPESTTSATQVLERPDQQKDFQGIASKETTNMNSNMPMNGVMDFNQMMQYGLPNGMIGSFPNIMSMPGMAMDPMTMAQGVYGGFAGQDFSGMKGMNGGMGFPNGQGLFGGYNGQPGAWNAGQNAFNQNAYGAFQGGYGAQSGYSDYSMSPQGNFNNVHQQQYQNSDYNSGHNGYGYQGRGRGRGRGYYGSGRGRGGYNQSHAGYDTNYQEWPDQVSNQYLQQPSLPNGDAAQTAADEQSQDEVVHTTERAQVVDTQSDNLDALPEAQVSVGENARPTHDDSTTGISLNKKYGMSETVVETVEDQDKPSGQQGEQEKTFINRTDDHADSENVTKETSVDGQISVDTSTMPPPPVVTAPSNQMSPTKEPSVAQNFIFRGRGRGYSRGGFDFRGGLRGRGSGYPTSGIVGHSSPQSLSTSSKPIIPPTEPKGLGVVGAPTGPKALREGSASAPLRGGRGFSIVGRASAAAQARVNGRAVSRSPSRSRSRSPSRKSSSHHHRAHRHRSRSSDESDDDYDKRRERRHRRSRKYEDKSDSEDDSRRKSSHRRHRDEDADHESRRSSHRSHRSHREKDKDRYSEHRSSRKHSTSLEDRIELKIPTGPKAERSPERDYDSNQSSSRKRRAREEEDDAYDRKRSRKERKDEKESRRSKRSHHDTSEETDSYGRTLDRPKDPAIEPVVDPYQLEREARTKERVQRENQRRLQMDGKAGKGAGLGRRVSYQYENEASSEARASRVESEREASRWG